MGYRLVAAAGAVGLIWWGVHASSNSNASAQIENTSLGTIATGPDGRDLTDTDADTSGVKGGETYDEYDARRDGMNGSAGAYEGFGCTQDCSGHEAGYHWAEAHDITDESDCGGKSWSFQEGCVAYAEEQSGEDSGASTTPNDQNDDATTSSDDDDPSDGN